MSGTYVMPGDPGWDEARVGRMFNGRRPDRQPDAVLIAESVEDVVAGVRRACDEGWSVAVRSGGHAWAGWSVRDGGLLIDLGKLTDISYDEETHVVSAGPAVKGGDTLSPFLEAKGRFFNGGHCPSVGIGGFLLQGGQGWCQRGWGWAAESVAAVDVVTADGTLLRCDEHQNSDLYWAARGAGPTFPGIVTQFHLRTRPLFGFVGHTVQAFRPEDFTDVMTWLYGVHRDISTDVEIVVISVEAPLEPGGVAVRHILVTGVALVEDETAAKEALAPFQDNPYLDRALLAQHCMPSSMAEQRVLQELANPEHARYVTDNIWVDGEVGDVVERIRPLFTDLPVPGAFSIWMSNAPMRDLPDMAFSLQTDAYVASYMVYDDPSQDEAHRGWLNRALEHAQPVTVGQYLGDSDMTNHQLRFMADDNWSRLQRVIEQRDPDGRFARYLAHDPAHLNINHWQI